MTRTATEEARVTGRETKDNKRDMEETKYLQAGGVTEKALRAAGFAGDLLRENINSWLRRDHSTHISVMIGSDCDREGSHIFYIPGVTSFDDKSICYMTPYGDTEFDEAEEAFDAAVVFCLNHFGPDGRVYSEEDVDE